ncbi:hypothetical protein Hanom_Chr06g00550521 [Helianthus anomalus]
MFSITVFTKNRQSSLCFWTIPTTNVSIYFQNSINNVNIMYKNVRQVCQK